MSGDVCKHTNKIRSRHSARLLLLNAINQHSGRRPGTLVFLCLAYLEFNAHSGVWRWSAAEGWATNPNQPPGLFWRSSLQTQPSHLHTHRQIFHAGCCHYCVNEDLMDKNGYSHHMNWTQTHTHRAEHSQVPYWVITSLLRPISRCICGSSECMCHITLVPTCEPRFHLVIFEVSRCLYIFMLSL